MTDYVTPIIQNMVSTALYIDFTDGILLTVICLAIIFSIQDYRIGLMALLVLSGVAYIMFTLLGLAVAHATMLLLLSVLLMAFSSRSQVCPLSSVIISCPYGSGISFAILANPE